MHTKDYEVRNDLEICVRILRRGNLASAVEASTGRLN